MHTHTLSLAIALVMTTTLCAQPTFNFNVTTFQSGTTGITQAQFVDAFQEGAELWSSQLSDDVTLNVELQFVDGDFLAGTETSLSSRSYSDVVNALTNKATTADELLAVGSLQSGPSVGMLINRTSQNGNSPNPYFDNNGSFNNSNVQLTDANAMALGFTDPNPVGPDMVIFVGNNPGGLLGNLINWDVDRSDGPIGPLAVDLVGVAAHELAHGMGFLSNVDFLDENTGVSEDEIFPTLADLFRFSSESFALGSGVFDMSVDGRDKYFSLDGGVTNLALFSEGANNGDERQASHWKDAPLGSTPLGLMDPTFDIGTLGQISQLDLRLMGTAGWTMAVPEPSGLVPGMFIIIGLCGRRRRSAGREPVGRKPHDVVPC